MERAVALPGPDRLRHALRAVIDPEDGEQSTPAMAVPTVLARVNFGTSKP